MCKAMWIFLTCLLLATALLVGVSATAGEKATVYLPSMGVSTLADAAKKLPNGGEIVVTQKVTVSAITVPEVNGDLTIRAKDEGALLLSGNLSFAKNTNANVITVDLPVTANGHAILGGFNSIVFGESFTTTDSLDFYGGVATQSGTIGEHEKNAKQNAGDVTELPYSITVNGGTFGTFAGGNLRNDVTDMFGSVAAPLTVTVNGGTFNDRFDLSGMSLLADDVTLTVNGGTFNAPIAVVGYMKQPRANTSYCSKLVASDRKYYVNDGDITLNLLGGIFNGGTVTAHEIFSSYTLLLRGDFTLNIGEGATFAEGTTLDATQVKAYAGEDKKATLVCPDASKFNVVRFDVVNGETVTCKEPLRIGFIGDSITEGTGAADAFTQSYSRRLYDRCIAEGMDVVFGNYGVGGSQALPRDNNAYYYGDTLACKLAEESGCDWFLIALGTNDSSVVGGTTGEMPLFAEAYEALLRRFGDLADTKKVFTTSALHRGVGTTATDVRMVSIIRPIQRAVTEKLAAESGKYIHVDLYALLYEAAVTDALFANDKLHPDADGYVIYANAIYDAIFGGVVEKEGFAMSDVYLSQNGRYDGAGTIDDPVSTLPEALSKLASVGTLHIVGDVTFNAKVVTPLYMEKITITGEGSGASLTVGDVFRLLSDSKLTNLHLAAPGSYPTLIAEWNNIEITESFTCTDKFWFIAGQMLYNDDRSTNSYDGPETSSSDRDLTVTVNGGTYAVFLGGNRRLRADSPFGTYSGSMTLTIGKGVTVKPSGTNGIGGQNYISGNVTAYINSWPETALARDYARLGDFDSDKRFDESNNTGTTVFHLGDGVTAQPIITGDFNGDDAVDLADALQMLKIYVDGHDGSEIHDFYSLREIKLINVLRALKKLV